MSIETMEFKFIILKNNLYFPWQSGFAALRKQKGPRFCEVLFVYPSDAILSRAAARQVSSAPQSLTTVFGMGTGVSSALLSLSNLNTIYLIYLPLR